MILILSLISVFLDFAEVGTEAADTCQGAIKDVNPNADRRKKSFRFIFELMSFIRF